MERWINWPSTSLNQWLLSGYWKPICPVWANPQEIRIIISSINFLQQQLIKLNHQVSIGWYPWSRWGREKLGGIFSPHDSGDAACLRRVLFEGGLGLGEPPGSVWSRLLLWRWFLMISYNCITVLPKAHTVYIYMAIYIYITYINLQFLYRYIYYIQLSRFSTIYL